MRTRLITLAVLAGATLVVPATAAQAAPTLCDGKVATIVGTKGPDVLTGTPGPRRHRRSGRQRPDPRW